MSNSETSAQPDADPTPDVAELTRTISTWPREVGALAVDADVAVDMILGMLDNGLGLTAVVEALVMHGELPSEFEVGDQASTLRLAQTQQGWRVA